MGDASARARGSEKNRPRDVVLVQAACAGDRRAFGELVASHRRVAFALAYALTHSSTVSEEITQDALLVAWRRIGDLDRPQRFRAWLCSIVRNLIMNHQSAERLHARSEERTSTFL